MNVVTLQVLLHHFSNPAPWTVESEASAEAHRGLVNNGLLLNIRPSVYETTAMGDAHVRQLVALPLPNTKSVFIGFDGKEIK